MPEQLRSPNLQTVSEFVQALERLERLKAGAKQQIYEEVISWPNHWWAFLSSRAYLKTRGRPRGSSTYPTTDDFLQAVRPIIQHLRRKGIYPSQARVVELLPVRTSVRQLQRWEKTYGFTWLDVLKSA